MHKTRKLFLLGLMLSLGLSLSACSSGASDQTSTSGTNQTESTAESSVPEFEIDAEYSESFTLIPGKTVYIHSKDISFTLDKINHFQNGRSEAYYTLKVDGVKYTGVGAWDEDGGFVNQVNRSPQRVYIDGADSNISATFRIEPPIEVPDPLILSGNPEDIYTTTKPEYVESEDIILFLDEGITLYGDTMDLIHTVKDLVEKETGLKLDAKPIYAETKITGVLEELFGQDAFPGVDPDKEKFHIIIVPFETASPGAMKGHIILNPMDLEIASGEGFALVHEMTHCVQIANGRFISTTMDEGFSTYITGQICDRDEIIPFNFNSEYNYSFYEKEITKKNAEAVFCEEVDDNWEKYLYGYRFVTYLFEAYGEDIYRNILLDASQTFKMNTSITEEMMIPVIKRNTCDTVFEDFAKWLSKNEDRFDGE